MHPERWGWRFVWFPTVDAENDALYKKKHASQQGLGNANEQPIRKNKIRILDEQGVLIPEVKEILQQVKAFNMVLATGHIAVQESLALVRAAAAMGIQKILVNHVSLPITNASLALQKEYIDNGAMVEHCYYTPMAGLCSWEEIAESIRTLGPEHVILSTDLGQPANGSPVEGMEKFAEQLHSLGILEEELYQMMAVNPERLLY